MKKSIKIFTDGSCKRHKNSFICGYGIHFPEKEFEDVSKHYSDNPTSNRAELYAIYKALKITKYSNYDETYIYSDSEYSINSLTKWIKGWEKNRWKKSDGNAVNNLDIILKIYKYLKKRKVIFTHVRAHTNKKDYNSIHNDIVDKLAKNGRDKKE